MTPSCGFAWVQSGIAEAVEAHAHETEALLQVCRRLEHPCPTGMTSSLAHVPEFLLRTQDQLLVMGELARHGYRLSPGTLDPMLYGMETKSYLRAREK